jgi:hypothetical protein
MLSALLGFYWLLTLGLIKVFILSTPVSIVAIAIELTILLLSIS